MLPPLNLQGPTVEALTDPLFYERIGKLAAALDAGRFGSFRVEMAIPGETRVISQGARVMKLDEERDKRHHHAQDAHGQVGSAQEGVLPTEEAGGGQHEALAALEGVGVVHIGNAHLDHLSRVQIMLDVAIQLPEAWQRCRSHPHHEVLVLAQGKRGIQACTAHGEPRAIISSPGVINVVGKVLGVHFA